MSTTGGKSRAGKNPAPGPGYSGRKPGIFMHTGPWRPISMRSLKPVKIFMTCRCISISRALPGITMCWISGSGSHRTSRIIGPDIYIRDSKEFDFVWRQIHPRRQPAFRAGIMGRHQYAPRYRPIIIRSVILPRISGEPVSYGDVYRYRKPFWKIKHDAVCVCRDAADTGNTAVRVKYRQLCSREGRSPKAGF